jgi:UDP-N-acetylglucosamine--N-acetylmuramyl-(pentapeptide) pyrophosphoryl-undecaprenol N-acetylglucosamine transferase
MRVVIAGGGTGGHLFPGLAVAQELKRRDSVAEILFVGSEVGIESRVVPQEGFPLETLPIKGIKGRGIRGFIEALWGIPVSFFRSLRTIGRFRPECVIGVGGYASGPFLVAGKMKGIRCVIMEQNLRPGLTNLILARLVDRVFTTYEGSAAYFPRFKVMRTGNPVRWRTLPPPERQERFSILVFGGSAGARRINLRMVEALERLKDLGPKLRITHQTGEADFASVRAAYSPLPFEAEILSFIERMDLAYARADLVICRAGATTIAELTAFGKPAILIPYPYAAYDHQRLNAQALKDWGAAEMILDRELNGESLASAIRALYTDRERLKKMGEAARKLGKPEAAERIVDECYALVGRHQARGNRQ